MRHELDLQTVTLDFWLNRLLMEKYGTRLSARIVYDKLYIYWWKGNPAKGKWIKICEGKIKAEVILPSRNEINKAIKRIEAGKK